MAAAATGDPQHAAFPTISSSNTPVLVPQSQSQTVEAVKDIAFGSTAGILGKFIEYPFDTIKVRLQSQSTSPHSTHRIHGPLEAFAAAWRTPEGPLRSLYRGISAPLFGAAVETSSLFFSYRIAQDILVATAPSLLRALPSDHDGTAKASLTFPALLVAGAASGALTSLLLTPIELIKCKMQVSLPPAHLASEPRYLARKPPGPIQLMKSVLKSQGLLGFWHGQLGTLIRESGGSSAWFGSYEGVKILFGNYNDRKAKAKSEHHYSSPATPPTTPLPAPTTATPSISTTQQLLAGAAAGVSYNFLFYPADTIKSRMQTEEAAAAGSRPTTFAATSREVWSQQGLKGFYRGCGITVFRSAPSSAIIFSIYEGLRRAFG